MANEPKKTLQPRAAQKEATRRIVLDAAKEEFAREGFENANLRAIAARAGVSAGTVLHHYGDKQELLHAALFDDLDRTLSRALAKPGPGPLESQLSRLTQTIFRYYQRRPRLSRALLKESLFANEPWAERFAAQTAEVHASLARLVEDAKERGEIRNDVVPALVGVAYLSFFYFALIAWVQGAHRTPVPLVEQLLHQHIEGLRPAPERKKRKT